MTQEKPRFVNVDELMPQVSLSQVAAFYGVALPELHRTGRETRTRCFLACGRTKETGERVLAIQEDDPARKWRCHDYGCGKGGNLVSLCDLLKPGPSMGGNPRGDRFKAIAADIRAMAEGIAGSRPSLTPLPVVQRTETDAPPVNIPLARSGNERARALTELDAKFIRSVDGMPPAASAYLRRRPYLSPEVMASWRVGFLPRNAGGDQAGGTMRGKIVYAFTSDDGELLSWFGRTPEYEAKHAIWEASDRSQREPAKFHFVSGFHRGIELYGQERIRRPEAAETLQRLGLVLVEGPNDVIRLSTLGVPAVALCSNTISRAQAEKAAQLAYDCAGGVVTVFLDCDAEGEKGMKQALGYLSQLVPVRLAWASTMHGGKFRGRQPESLTEEEWKAIASFLSRVRSDASSTVEDTPPPTPEADEWSFV